jgi:hypothetical protein
MLMEYQIVCCGDVIGIHLLHGRFCQRGAWQDESGGVPWDREVMTAQEQQ